MRYARLSIAVFLAVACVGLPALADETAINLGPEELVKADGSDIVVPGYSVPSFEDWNGDHLQDLIVGEGGSGFDGKVRVYLNVGTESDPCFTGFFYARYANGEDLTCTPQGCLGCFPRVVYWDEDNRKDLLVGLADGTAKVFLNVASANEPAFDGGQNVMVGNESAYWLDTGSRATPDLVHWNDDGMLDIVSGGLDGLIHVYYNCGCGGAIPPHFFYCPPDGAYVQENNRDLQVPAGRSSPVVVDADGDGKKDLLSGNTDGMIFFYKNVGLDSLPAFSGYSLVKSNGQPIDLAGSLRSRPAVCYWTGTGRFGPRDGYWDLLVGYGDGKVRLYRGIAKTGDFDADGELDADDFTFLVKALDQPIPPEGTAADLNGDGAVDDLDLRLFADLWLAAHK
ncbi:MAG: hypothetical protein JW955_14560 [Sedimentisphaerales bacterium]|nr:hypothetical protein [Sedimentisphaerales bacterium]